jgi:general secretion pathway protein A
MYRKHFNLNENPFSIAPDPRYLYMSHKHREALAHLMYGLKTDGGFVLLTGEVGTGKTTVCRCLLEQLPEDLNVAFVLNPKLTSAELLATICDEFGINYRTEHPSIKELVDNINHFLLDAHANGRKTVLIIDEAQNLDPDVLEQIRLLTNLETNQRKLLQIVMLGQPELRDQLARPELRQLAQRITARYHLGPLDRSEIAPYINHRLGVAGHHKKLFPDKVINKIYRLTNGIPRLINVLCDRTLLGTYVEGREQVNHLTLKKAAREVFGQSTNTSEIFKWLIPALFIISLAGAIFFSGVLKPAKDADTGKQSVVQSMLTAAQTDRLSWSTDIPLAKSRTTAFDTIFASWSKVYQAGLDTTPCEQAVNQGLACLDRQGSLGSLRHLNRPAVLQLIDQRGRRFYAPLLKLTDSKASLLINAKEITVSTTALEKQWFGSYTILWQPPPGYSKPIKPEAEGQDVEWLASQIKMISGPQTTATSLGQMVTSYQKNEGLIADGIAGPETLIHLNSSVGRTGPTLVE